MERRLQSLQDTGHTTPERLRPVGPGTVRAAGRPAPRRSPSSRGPGRTAVRTGPLSHRDVPAGRKQRVPARETSQEGAVLEPLASHQSC